MSNEELLIAFSDFLDAALNMNLEAQIEQLKNIPRDREHEALSCHRNAMRTYRLRHAFCRPEQTKQKILAAVKDYAANHDLQGLRRKDYCSMYPERSFERAALGTFFGFLRILQSNEVTP